MNFRAIIWYYLIVAPHLLLGIVLALMLRRRLHRQFPIFFAYVISEILQFVILFPMILLPSVSAKMYGVSYSCGLAVSTALRFGIIYEITTHVFRNSATLSRFGRPLFRWVAVGLLCGGLLLALYTGANDFNRLAVVHLLDRTASILQCGLLVLLFAFSSSLGLSWRTDVFGIALGLGSFASVQLIASAIRAQTGYRFSTYLDYLTMGTYHCCVLIWACYLWAPERRTLFGVEQLPQHDLDHWNQELQRILNR